MNLLLCLVPIPPILLIVVMMTLLALMGELKTPPSDAMFGSSCIKHTTPSTMVNGLENGDLSSSEYDIIFFG